ncbi:MAG: hypothetical protein K0R28_2670 [Paenibacillus sp.]|nr:hypothetical protein [Paenibacillus sp.]
MNKMAFHTSFDPFLDGSERILEQYFVVLDQIDPARGLTVELMAQLFEIVTDDGLEYTHEQRAVMNAEQPAHAGNAEFRSAEPAQERRRELQIDQLDLPVHRQLPEHGYEKGGDIGAEVDVGIGDPDIGVTSGGAVRIVGCFRHLNGEDLPQMLLHFLLLRRRQLGPASDGQPDGDRLGFLMKLGFIVITAVSGDAIRTHSYTCFPCGKDCSAICLPISRARSAARNTARPTDSATRFSSSSSMAA